MDESNCNGKEPEMSIKNTKRLDHWYNVEYTASPRVVKRDMAQKLYQFLSFFKSSITQELDKCKKDEIRINNDIKWFAIGDKGGKWKKQHSEHVEEALGKEEELELQMRPIPRTDAGLINYTTDTHWIYADRWKISDVCTDKKRCHNRLNKGRMDLEYLKQVQDELISQEKSTYLEDGTQELDYVMESLVHRIQHGNNNRADEGKLYQGIRMLNNTMEIYTAPTEPDDHIWGPSSTRPALDKQQRQHQSKIVLNQLKKARTIRRGQLNLELDLLRQKIRCMERLLEKISLKMKAAYKCAYELAEQQNKKSSYSECKSHMTYVKEQAEYKSLMTYVKELARRGDIMELMQVCDRQLFEGCSKFYL